MRRLVLSAVVLLVAIGLTPIAAQQNPYLGVWNITPAGATTGPVYWLAVKEQNGQLTGMFLNGGGHALPLASVKVENGELVFLRGNPPQQTEYRARMDKGTLVVHTITAPGRRGGDPSQPAPPAVSRQVTWIGVRPPAWPAANANGRHTYGKPVALFDGTSLDAFSGQMANRTLGWAIEDGVMSNAKPPANNLVSKEKFTNFKVNIEYRLAAKSNSGIYLRGRYELQVLDDINDTTAEPFLTHMAIYGRTAPAVKASKPAGEWQAMEATLVGNRVTVTLNGRRVHDDVAIIGITGGALDADELAPGPLMIQGDHGQVWVRKVVVTPITKAGK